MIQALQVPRQLMESCLTDTCIGESVGSFVKSSLVSRGQKPLRLIAHFATLALVVLAPVTIPHQGTLAETPETQTCILDLFPDCPSKADEGTTNFTQQFSPSESNWADGLDERQVFLGLMEHQSDPQQSWQLRVGKGGQVYSLIGPFGESVPPQTIDSRWNDEVWQFVATSAEEINPIHEFERSTNNFVSYRPMEYFIHQSGTYSRQDPTRGSFYSPCLRLRYDSNRRSLELVNWIQQANAPAVWTSGLLVYTRYRDVGRGAIEVTYVVHNFGSETLEYLNTPWGGVRKSSLPHVIMSSSDGSWNEVTGKWGWEGIAEKLLRDTAGWCAWTQRPNEDDSPTLFLVFGRDSQSPNNAPASSKSELAPQKVRWGTANETERDYEATEVVSQPRFEPGQTLFFRYFFTIGPFSAARKVADALVPLAEHGLLTAKPDSLSVAVLHVGIDASGQATIEAGPGIHNSTSLKFVALPSPDAVPVFLLKDNFRDKLVVSSDPYALATSRVFSNPLPAEHPEREKYNDRRLLLPGDGRTTYLNLLGYALRSPSGRKGNVEWLPLHQMISDTCPSIVVDPSCDHLSVPK